MPYLDFDIHEIMQHPDKQEQEAIEKLLRTPIEDLDLSVRAFNALRIAKMNTLKDIVSIQSPNDFFKYRHIGKKSFLELEALLYNFGLKWRFVDVMTPPATHPALERQLVVLHMGYPLSNFVWAQIIIEAFEKYDIKTIGDLLASRQILLNHPTMLAKDFDFIEKCIKDWKVKW